MPEFGNTAREGAEASDTTTTNQGESKEIADLLFSRVSNIVPGEKQEAPSEEYQNRERQN